MTDTDTNAAPERSFEEGIDYTTMPLPPTPIESHTTPGYWRLPTHNPPPARTAPFVEGVDYTRLMPTLPAPTAPAPLAPVAKTKWYKRKGVFIPVLLVAGVAIGAAGRHSDKATPAAAAPAVTTADSPCGPNDYTSRCVLARGDVPDAVTQATDPFTAWMGEYSTEIYSFTGTIQTDTEAMGRAGEAGDAVTLMSLCESAIDDIDTVLASDAYNDPNAPAEFHAAMMNYREGFTFCALGYFDSSATSLAAATANIHTLTEMTNEMADGL